MKKLAIVFIGLFLMAFSMNALAQNSATAMSLASIDIIAPITLQNNNTLEFGKITRGTEDGSITIAPQLTPSRTLVNVVGVYDNDYRAAPFTVTGYPNETFKIDLPETISLTGSNGGTLSIATTMSGQATGNVIPADNPFIFYVGGTMTILSDQILGSYSGPFSVTVTYE